MAAAAEGVVHQLHRHHPRRAAVRPQPPPYRVAERQHGGVRLFGAGQVPRQRHAVAVGVVPGVLFGHRVGFAAVGVVPQGVAPHAEQVHDGAPLALRQVPDGQDAAAVQLFHGAGPHAEQRPYRQGPHLGGHLGRVKGVDLVGLFKVGGHLGQQPVGGHADVDGEPQFPPHPLPDGAGRLQRRAEQGPGAGHVQERLVDAVLLHIGGIVPQNGDQGLAVLHVPVEIRRRDDELRALEPGREQAFPRMDAEGFGRAALGQHHAVALFLVAAHRRGHRAQIESLPLPQQLERRPGQERRVHIHMEIDLVHRRTPFACIIAHRGGEGQRARLFMPPSCIFAQDVR